MSNKHIGSNFDEFLREEGTLEETTATALKRVIAWQVSQTISDKPVQENPAKPSSQA